jgi:hypothetical protein
MYPPAITTITADELELFAEVDRVIVRSITAGDPLIAADYGTTLIRKARLKGLALSKLLHGLQSNWSTFRAAGLDEEFEDFAYTYLETPPETSRKYVGMWRGIFENPNVPADVKQQLQMKPIEHLIMLTAAVEEGSIDADDLREAAVSDKEGIRSMVRGARGEQTSSKTAIRRFIQMRDGDYPAGTLIANCNGEWAIIGMVDLNPDAEFAKKAVRGLLNSKVFIERN